jgi:hypothetical protein
MRKTGKNYTPLYMRYEDSVSYLVVRKSIIICLCQRESFLNERGGPIKVAQSIARRHRREWRGQSRVNFRRKFVHFYGILDVSL